MAHVPINLGCIRRTERTHLNMHWHAHTVFKLQRRLNGLSSNTSLTKRHQHTTWVLPGRNIT
ncbi:MAG TPA: hypothetical protein ACQGQX_03505 [Xylella taiwanensis]